MKRDQTQIFVLDASAGTGKTYSLAERYLRLIFESFSYKGTPSINEIIAITFTNKACFEMKQRILEMLKKIALDKFEKIEEKNDIIFKLNFQNLNVLKRQAETIIEEILKNYHFFQIYTIDSFIHTLAKAYAFHLRISPNFKVETSLAEYLDYSVDYMIDKASESKKIKQLLKEFLKTYLLVEHKRSFNPKTHIFKIIRVLYEYSSNYSSGFKKFETFRNFFGDSKNLIKNIRRFYEKIPKEKINKNFINGIEKFLEEHKTSSVIKFENLSKWLLREEIPINKGHNISNSFNNEWKKIKKSLSELCTVYARGVYNNYIEIYNLVNEILDNIAQKQDIIFLEDLNKKISYILSFEEFIPELFIRLSTTIKHFLIDEFQDTSVLQWENLVPIISQVLASNGTLFYVGDKKQSIYRFRGGEAVLFDRVKDYFGPFKIQIDSLNKNRRSKKEIVEFNNFIFSKENLEKFCREIKIDNTCFVSKILGVYSNTQQEPLMKAGGFVYGELIEEDNYEELVRQKLLKIIKDFQQKNYNISDIAILVRKTDEAAVVSEWLLEERISVESEKTLNVKDNYIIKEIISLLKFLNFHFDNISFVSFLLGKIFIHSSKITLEEIQNFVLKVSRLENVVFCEEFKKEYPQLWDKFFSYLFEVSGFLSVYNLLLKIYSVFDLKTNPEFVRNYAFFVHLLNLAKKAEEKNGSLNFFLNFIENLKEEDLHINAKAEKSVKVLTIHKAKGLEFKVVIIPFLEIEIEVGRHKGVSSRFLVVKEKNSVSLIKSNKKLAELSEEVSKFYNEEYVNLLIDELNVLYVALTRAKDQLYFFVPQKNSNLAVSLFPWQEGILKRGSFSFEEDVVKPLAVIKFQPSEYRNWQEILIEERITKEEILNKQKIIDGKILHTILSFVGSLYDKDVEYEIETAIKKTKRFFNIKNEELQVYKQKVLNLIQKEDVKKLFFVEKEDLVFCEQDIISKDGEVYRPDRLIIKEKEINIVDYKLSSKEKIQEYKSQLEKYAALVESICKKPTKKYILFLDTLDLLEI